MAFVTGLMLIDAPASALNNAGAEDGARTDNTIAVKRIRTKAGDYPYVSAQAVRYWYGRYWSSQRLSGKRLQYFVRRRLRIPMRIPSCTGMTTCLGTCERHQSEPEHVAKNRKPNKRRSLVRSLGSHLSARVPWSLSLQ